jgi:hypothetical protein
MSHAVPCADRAERRVGARLSRDQDVVDFVAAPPQSGRQPAGLHFYASAPSSRTHYSAAKSARPIQRLTESPWCSISLSMASGVTNVSSQAGDSMTHGNGLPLALFSWGVAFGLKRRRRHAALTSHGISPAARRARANAEAGGCGPAAAMVDLLPAAGNPHICSGKTLVSGLRAVPLPSSGHTPLAVRLTVGDPHLLARFWPENWQALRACRPGNPHVPQEIRAGYQNNITSECCGGDSRLVCN